MLYFIIIHFNSDFKKIENFTHSNSLEIIWTLIPALILLLISIPSFTLLYSLDENIVPKLTVKIIGHQWYWSYEYDSNIFPSFVWDLPYGSGVAFDSYMLNSSNLKHGTFRLLEVDYRMILPIKQHIRLLISSADVLHSWCIPSFGIKVDACPGRLSQASLFLKREGVYYGQCSEICGINHGFMPIVVCSLTTRKFDDWLLAKIGGFTRKEMLGIQLHLLENYKKYHAFKSANNK